MPRELKFLTSSVWSERLRARRSYFQMIRAAGLTGTGTSEHPRSAREDVLTDEQVEQIRDSLYQLADLFIREYIKTKKAGKSPMNHAGDHLLPSFNQGTGRERL